MHSQLLHGTAHLRGTLIIDLPTTLRRKPEMGSAVGIERTEQPVLFNHRAQPGHHCGGCFLRRQLRIIDLTGGIVQDPDQAAPTFVLKPLMLAAVDVQHHPRKRTPFTPLAVHTALGLALYQTGCLQSLLHPRVAPSDLMFLAELLMKVPHVQIEVLVPVEAQNLFRLRLRHSPAAWLPLSPVQQSRAALFFEALPPSTHLALADAHQLRCLPPLDLPPCGS